MIWLKCLLTAAACLYGSMLYAQRTITGKVIDKVTKEAIAGASIRFMHRTAGIITNSSGSFFVVDNTPVDSLLISAIGYKPAKFSTGDDISLIQLSPSSTGLNELVISASREGEERISTPVAISSISRQVINETKAITLDQLLNKVSGVYMVDLGNEQHTMSIRQPINYSSVYLYLEDGIPIRTIGDFNHNALIEINAAALNNIEVIRGPSSSLYGSDAIGGAVNFITQAPAAIPTAKVQLEANNYGYRRTDFSVSDTRANTGFSIAGYYANQHDTYKQHNDFHKLALTFRLDEQLSRRSRWINSLTWIKYKTDQTGGLDSLDFYTKNYTSYYTFTYRKVDALRFRSTLEHQWNNSNHTQFTLYYHQNAIGQNPFYAIQNTSDPLKANGQINTDAFHSFGLIAQHKKILEKLRTEWITGISLSYSPASYHANYIGINKNAEGYYTSYINTDSLLTDYKVYLLNTAAYTQVAVNPVDPLRIVAALRYDRLDDDFRNFLPPAAYSGAPSEKNHFGHLTPKAGLTYNFGKGRRLYANYSMGFAPPEISDLYTGVKVPVLKPSYYNNYEIGGWYGSADGRASMEASLYRMQGNNEIIAVRLDDGSYQNRNAGKTLHYGVEYTLRYTPSASLLLAFNGTNAHHEFLDYQENGKDYSHHEMNEAPGMIFNTDLTYKPGYMKGFRIGAEWQHVGKYFIDPANTQVYGGYDLFNIRAGYTFHSVEFWLNILNMFNRIYATAVDYAAYGNAYRPGLPRTFQFGITYNFTGKHEKTTASK